MRALCGLTPCRCLRVVCVGIELDVESSVELTLKLCSGGVDELAAGWLPCAGGGGHGGGRCVFEMRGSMSWSTPWAFSARRAGPFRWRMSVAAAMVVVTVAVERCGW